MESFFIGQLAHRAGVNVETVRYYERRGLLREPPRSAAGYRQYSADDLWRLEFIARAKRLGFTLAEVSGLVGGQAGPDSVGSVLSLARAKIEALDERRRALDETRSRLTRLVGICEDPDSEDCRALRVPS
jgi:MerR family mercuric resistance operon transcriptional regulator